MKRDTNGFRRNMLLATCCKHAWSMYIRRRVTFYSELACRRVTFYSELACRRVTFFAYLLRLHQYAVVAWLHETWNILFLVNIKYITPHHNSWVSTKVSKKKLVKYRAVCCTGAHNSLLLPMRTYYGYLKTTVCGSQSIRRRGLSCSCPLRQITRSQVKFQGKTSLQSPHSWHSLRCSN
jgi:hypothetical protein